MIDRERLARAYRTARSDLLNERTAAGHWVGELASSALSTATAVSALCTLRESATVDEARRFDELIASGLRWIFERQNSDGGWGDTDQSVSNISTTMLVRAATHLAGEQHTRADSLARAEQYIAAKGGIAGLKRRYGRDKTFAVPILANCAIAGLVPWHEVSPLPFELACLPQSWYRFVRLPVVSYAIPALVAIGQAVFKHRGTWNPLLWLLRKAAIQPSLNVLQRMQPASGGYLEATPLTSFVVMSLASSGHPQHPVTRLGCKFLLNSVRGDGSWPIDTNLATWVTTLAINALAEGEPAESEPTYLNARLLAWLLGCQNRERHPFTGASPGGWGWSDLSGSVPDADDTPGALLALAQWEQPAAVLPAVLNAIDWLLALQNRDGGWPTFCRGWGILPFDRSGTDLTAHALRALHVWKPHLEPGSPRLKQLEKASQAGLEYLRREQRADGSWLPLWFGNQRRHDDENPLYGTAKVLLAYRDLRLMSAEPAQRAVRFLAGEQNADGGWGNAPPVASDGRLPAPEQDRSSVEETALVVEALLADDLGQSAKPKLLQGVEWLVATVEAGRHRETAPIGFYFAKLWYYERLYPIIFIVSALGHALAGGLCKPNSPEQTIAPVGESLT